MTLSRKKPLRRSTKRIPRINLARAAKRRDRFSAYLRSPEWKEKKRQVRERSHGQCERIHATEVIHGDHPAYPWTRRCWGKASICNHKTYARFGRELLTDLEDLCESCDRIYEGARPWRAARRAALARAAS